MDLSNKSLALLLVAAIVISLGGTLIGLNKLNQGVTGLASGKVELTVDSYAGCVVEHNVSFGTDFTELVTLSTERDNTPEGFNNCLSGTTCSGLQINNTGNEEIYVNFTSNNAATSSFPGGPSAVAADFRYAIKNGTDTGTLQGCRNITGRIITAGTWATVNTSNNQICRNLTPSDLNDIMTMEFNVTLRPDTPAGAKTAIITVDCIDLQ